MFNSKANHIKILLFVLFIFISTLSFSQKKDENIKFQEKKIENHLNSTKRILIKKGLDESEINKILKNEENNLTSQFTIESEIQVEPSILSKEKTIIQNDKKSQNQRITSCGTVPPNEKTALLAFLQSTQEGSSTWANNTNLTWDSNTDVISYYQEDASGDDIVINGVKQINPNGWFGIKVRNCHVEKIELPSNHLNGKIPNLSALQFLETLNLSGNNIYELHNANISSINSLKTLNLASNSFGSFGINAQLQNLSLFMGLSNLTYLDLHGNGLRGSIDISINTLISLTHLDLSANYLQGSIHSNINSLVNLTRLDLSYNSFSGDIPNLSQLTNLKQLNLNRYSFDIYTNESISTLHPIPSSFQYLVNLEILLLSKCGLGNDPNTINNLNLISNLPKLHTLYLDDNRFSGAIPNFSGLTSLTTICLRNNQFNDISGIGNISTLQTIIANNNLIDNPLSSFANLTNLKHLNLSYNLLNTFPLINSSYDLSYLNLGFNRINNLPTFLSGLDKIIYFYLNDNEVTGSIPGFLFNKNTIQFLTLSNNLLSGNIPDVIDLSSLKILALDSNELYGNIPNSFQNLPSINHIFLNNNNLEGIIPSLTNLPSLSILTISNNKFRFKDFVNEYQHYRNNLSNIFPTYSFTEYSNLNYNTTYSNISGYPNHNSAITIYRFSSSPQAEIDEEIYVTKTIGSSYTLTMYVAPDTGYLADDLFQWVKIFGSNLGNVGSNSSSSRQLVLSNLSLSDSGIYECYSKHTNPDISINGNTPYTYLGLTLKRKKIHLTVLPPAPCFDCTSFDLLKDEKYLLSAWVKEEYSNNPEQQFKNYSKSTVNIGFTAVDGTTIGAPIVFYPSGEIIDGWQRIIGEFVVPTNVDDMTLELVNLSNDGKVSYFDDVRVLPSRGNMKSFVYDQNTQRLMAELDENNYSTFYEYDLEGGLIRVKKETERGVFTIQETRSGNVKN